MLTHVPDDIVEYEKYEGRAKNAKGIYRKVG